MQRSFLIVLCFIAMVLVLNRCTKDPVVVGEGEPIAILEPIQNPTLAESGKDVAYQVNIVTDRNIDSVAVFSHLDTTNSGYRNGDPLTFVRSHIPATKMNMIKFDGTVTIPAGRKYGDVVRVIYKLRAQDRYAEKILRINVK